MGGEDMGGAGAGGEPSTGGAGGSGAVAGGGAGGSAGTSAGAAGLSGGGTGGAGTGGGGTGGSGGGACTESPIRCALGTCPAGTSPAFYTASNVPVAIPDAAANPALVTIAITTPGLVSKIVAQTSITHPFDGDLDISLVTPYFSRDLSSDNGSGGDNYTNTVFADSGTAVITSGTAPFTGIYRPEQELASLSGTLLAGNYRLQVVDDATGDIGQVTNFALGVCQCLASSGNCEFGLACQNGLDDDGDGLVDCQESACTSAPGCPKPESACGDGIDNDADNLTDCADPSCAWACTALSSACTGTNRLYTYRSNDLPQVITDAAQAQLLAPIYTAAGGTIVAAAIRFSAEHDFVADLDLSITSPGGTLLDLTSDNGSGGDDYLDTVFIDSAATSITAGTPPFTGSFRPEQALSAWAGQTGTGLWHVNLFDDASSDGGNLTEVSLALCVAP
jgi:subtilisin-like proprotein convertase family protein